MSSPEVLLGARVYTEWDLKRTVPFLPHDCYPETVCKSILDVGSDTVSNLAVPLHTARCQFQGIQTEPGTLTLSFRRRHSAHATSVLRILRILSILYSSAMSPYLAGLFRTVVSSPRWSPILRDFPTQSTVDALANRERPSRSPPEGIVVSTVNAKHSTQCTSPIRHALEVSNVICAG